MSIHTLSATSTWHIYVLALLWLVAHLNGQVGWVRLHLLSFLLLPCWWPLPFWTCLDTVPSPCKEGGSSTASQEGLRQLRGAAQLTTSQLSSAPLQSLVHHCMHHCTDCAGGQWQCQHKWQEDWQQCHCGLTANNCDNQQEGYTTLPEECTLSARSKAHMLEILYTNKILLCVQLVVQWSLIVSCYVYYTYIVLKSLLSPHYTLRSNEPLWYHQDLLWRYT